MRVRAETPFGNFLMAALRRMGMGKKEMMGHGFRAMASTILDEVLGFRPDFIYFRTGDLHLLQEEGK